MLLLDRDFVFTHANDVIKDGDSKKREKSEDVYMHAAVLIMSHILFLLIFGIGSSHGTQCHEVVERRLHKGDTIKQTSK